MLEDIEDALKTYAEDDTDGRQTSRRHTVRFAPHRKAALIPAASCATHTRSAVQQNCWASFSAVSKPIFASKYLFVVCTMYLLRSIFQDLHDLLTFGWYFQVFSSQDSNFCTLPNSIFADSCRILQTYGDLKFFGILKTVADFSLESDIYHRDFHRLLSEFREIPDKCRRPMKFSNNSRTALKFNF